jgi:hypothetical protein
MNRNTYLLGLLSKCVIVAAFFYLFSLDRSSVYALQLQPISGNEHCFLLLSSKMTDEMRASVSQYFGEDCNTLPASSEDPFSESGRSLWPAATGLGFWVGYESRVQELMVRGFDLQTKWQFGSAKGSTVGVTNESINIMVKTLLSEVIKQHRMIGLIDSKGYWIWTETLPAHLEIVERKASKRHPFLPILVEMENKSLSAGSNIFVQAGNLVGVPKNLSLDTKSSLWLKAVANVR